MSKKKIIAIVLFLFMSLFMFTFANPSGFDEGEVEKPNEQTEPDNSDDVITPVVEEVDNAPVITVNPKNVKVIEGNNYDVYTGVTVRDDKDNNLKVTASLTDIAGLAPRQTYVITYSVTDSGANRATNTRSIQVLSREDDEDNDGFTNGEEEDEGTDFDDPDNHPETIAPVITLKGLNPYIMLSTWTYVEAGYELTLDPHDTITTLDDVTIDGVVENVPATYVLTYSITDRYGKAASTSRDVKVLDPDADEDGDGFTNEEEMENEDSTDPFDKESHPETIAPVITLKGSNPYIMLSTWTYVEAGYELTLDPHDTITTKNDVVVTFDVLALGNNVMTYSITDRYGKNDTKTRTITVLDPDADEDGDGFTNEEEMENEDPTDPFDKESHPDTIAPVITLKGQIEFNLEYCGTYVEAGYELTLDPHDTITTLDDVEVVGVVTTSNLGVNTITYSVEDRYGKTNSKTRTVNVVDTTVPVIAAVEDVTVEVHSTYTDTLPTATDNYDSRIEVTSMGDIDLDVVGTYTIAYTATDANGNAAVAVTRTVNVVDTTVPVITLIGDASIEIQRNSTYIELGATVSDNYDTDIEATIDSTNVDMTKLGSYVVTYNATDANGNTATEVTRTIVVVRSDDDKELNRITVNPNTMNYKLYETIDKTAYVVTAIDNDGTTHELTIDDWTHSTLNTSTIGNGRVLTVSYTKNTVTKIATVTYNVSLSEEDLTVEFTAPTLLIYRQDSTLDLTGGKFVITYNENTEQFNLTADEVTITGFNSSTVTESLPVTATLNYHGLNISRVFNVKIIEIKKVWIILTDITTSNPVKEESTLSIEVIAQSAIKEYKYVKFDGNVEDVTYEYISENGTDIVAEGANSTHATNTMTITESGLYCVAARDASIKSRGFECIDITIPDLTKPTLTVNPTTVTIKRGENYDLMTGVSATDNVDNNVKITSSINTTTDLIVGNHVVTYTATDKSGNSITATRTIVVNRNDDDKTIVSITLEAKPNIQLIFQKNVSYNIKEYVNVYKVAKDGVKELANDNEYTINNFSVTSVGTRNMTATLNSITSNTLSYEVRNDSVEQDKFKLFYRADGVYYQTKSYGCTGNNGYCNVAGSNTNKIDKDFSLLEAIEYYEMNIDFSSVRINYTNSSYNETALLLNHTWNYNRKTYTADYSSWKNIDSNSSKWDVARIITTNRTTNSGTTADVMDATHIIDTVEIRYVRTIEHYFAADEIQNWVILFKYNGESQLKAIDEYQVD